MIIDDEQNSRSEVMPLEVKWRNSVPFVRAHLKAKERSNPYYGWAEQAKIGRRANWDPNHNWAA